MSELAINVAGREMRRLVNEAVKKSFIKALTEPLTNSDSALKEQANVSHTSGLIEQMLKLQAGQRLDSSQLKKTIHGNHKRRIVINLYRHSTERIKARTCDVIDYGPGMSSEELEENFKEYAAAKQKGKSTRSLFGRGASDVMLAHEDGVIYSIKERRLAECRFYWSTDKKPMMKITKRGASTPSLLSRLDLPADLRDCGTVVRFRVSEGTSVPQSADILRRVSSFYMLRLIASDPNVDLRLHQERQSGRTEDRLSFDFPIGDVVCRISEKLDLGSDGLLDVDILLARSTEKLQIDPTNREQRENGLLFVDENDAVLDLTLGRQLDGDPLLSHMFGVVRITGIRKVIEDHLESADAEAVLTQTRDGFNLKSAIAQKLFDTITKHVQPFYDHERKIRRRGESNRSEELSSRINSALKTLNRLAADETESESEGTGVQKRKIQDPMEFASTSMTLVVGKTRKTTLFVDLERTKKGEAVLFETDNPEIRVEPESELLKKTSKKELQAISVSLSSATKGQRGTVTALTLDAEGNVVSASLNIDDVIDPPTLYVPDSIEFSRPTFQGSPNRSNQAVLLVNLDAFTGHPRIKFTLDKVTGNVTLGCDEDQTLEVKVGDEHIDSQDPKLARVRVDFSGTGWGQYATLFARAKNRHGERVTSQCRILLQRPTGNDRFDDFIYEPYEQPSLGQVIDGKIYVNASNKLHRRLFGDTQDDFESAIERDTLAQLRVAQVVVEAAVYDIAATKYEKGGNQGLHINIDDPISSIRSYVDSSRAKVEASIVSALVTDT